MSEVKRNQVVSITENEYQALCCCLNYYFDRQDQKDDNFSNGGMKEFMTVLGWNKHQVSGLISSMEQKGFGEMEHHDERGDGEKYDIFWLSESGIDSVFDVLEGKIETIK